MHAQQTANKDVNVCLVIFVITVAHVSLLVTVTAVARTKLLNHVVVTVVNQHAAGQVDQTGIVIILALRDVNVMMDSSVISLVTVSPKPHVQIHSARLMKKLIHVTMNVKMLPVTTTISTSPAQQFQHLNARPDVNVKLDMFAIAKESVLHQHHAQ